MKSLVRSLIALAFSVLLAAEAAEFRLNLSRAASESGLTISGDNDEEYLLESSASLFPDNWSALGAFVMTNEVRLWRQPGTDPARFFRATQLSPYRDKGAPNFRLIDQDGKSRELLYYRSLASVRAIVITFAQGNYTAFASKIAALKANSMFQNSVMFWTVETGASNTRTNIKAQATAAGITWPVFHDPLNLAARDYDAHFNGEAFLIYRPSMEVVYRGAIDANGVPYLATALTNLLQSDTIITTRFEPSQNPITRRSASLADYSTVIAPLLQSKCQTCHSPGNIAPFSLTNYQSVLDHADLIKAKLMAHEMPPWGADPEYGKFKNDDSLTPTELAQLVDWLDAGRARGSGADDPLTKLPPEPSKWPADLGEPDQVVTIPPQSIVASGTEPYRYIFANATNATEKWLRAAVVRPSNRKVVHHYIVWNGHSTTAQLSGIATYVPGRTNIAFPSGTGVRLAANAPLTFNLHYTADGENEIDQPELGLWYAATPPAKEMKIAFPWNPLFTIPPNNPEYEVSSLFAQTFSAPARIYSLSPHMHVRGLRMRFELTQPGVPGKQILLSVPKYSFDWQTIYYLDPPLDVPANSQITCVGAYDNSAQNRDNPNPNISVSWGEQSWDEMFIGYIEYSDR